MTALVRLAAVRVDKAKYGVFNLNSRSRSRKGHPQQSGVQTLSVWRKYQQQTEFPQKQTWRSRRALPIRGGESHEVF
jgi:hypothetical protein